MAGQTLSSGPGDPFTAAVAVLFLAAGVVIAPVAAIVGAGVGAAKGTDPAKVMAARANLESALRDVTSAEAIRAAMIERAATLRGRALVDCGDTAIPEACSASPGDGAVTNLILLRANPPYFEVDGEFDPDLRVLLRAEATIHRADKAEPIYFRAWLFRGRRTSYLDLARDGAAQFRQQLAAGEKAIATKAVSDLLLGGAPELHDTPEQPEGAVWTVMPPGVPQAAVAACAVPLAVLSPATAPPAVPGQRVPPA
jgi:hypothetical protein